jgi:hypothetical protein
MSVSKMGVLSAALALSILPMGMAAREAAADEVQVVFPVPFFPRADFQFEDGYYRNSHGHYYHYDHDRDGWHYGRNHEEGMRYERRHHRHHSDR